MISDWMTGSVLEMEQFAGRNKPLTLDDALAAEDAIAANVVKLRYFVGMTIPEIAKALEISSRSADRHWVFARAWLKGAIRSG